MHVLYNFTVIAACFSGRHIKHEVQHLLEASSLITVIYGNQNQLTRQSQWDGAKHANDIVHVQTLFIEDQINVSLEQQLLEKRAESTHQTESMGWSQTCQQHCACTDADHRRPDQSWSWTDHPQHPRNGSPGPCRRFVRQRRETSRWQHHDSAPSALHPVFLCVQHNVCHRLSQIRSCSVVCNS